MLLHQCSSSAISIGVLFRIYSSGFFGSFVTADPYSVFFDPDHRQHQISSLFGWLVADGWCWFVLREEYCWLVAGG
jgi:hypothetical protein